MSARIICGDVREVLPTLPDASVQCCVTSPPYWGLRDYGHAEQLGLERTPQGYVAKMVAVFREVRRVLRDDGVLWLNLGDNYAGSGKGGNPDAGKQATNRGSQTVGVLYGATAREAAVTNVSRDVDGIRPKNLIGIPWRVAFALQEDGWYLRSDCIWAKPNPMPESVTDRPTKAHEYLFLLSKSASYFYDADAIAEDAVRAGDFSGTTCGADGMGAGYDGNRTRDGLRSGLVVADTRNKRTVWTIATQPYSGAHFAVMPEALAEPCILAGSRDGDTILDPFAGSGTVGVVALKRGRSFLGVELNPKYAAMARERIVGDAPLLNRAEVA